ncbi:Uncharacterized protein dnm_022120 [Desulfonema magnum]|uniref:Uncharacterized protein n=1 Tax=Desulfonema magnum TaxID=45655 RepID=A0A975BIP3_9BACT|nr:Uncharacterized protein dnm_022120 [Desulfonema magnum]
MSPEFSLIPRKIGIPEGSMAMTGHESGEREWREIKERL